MTLKKLKNKFQKDQEIKLNEKNIDLFYNFYFKKIKDKLGKSIEDFKDPLNNSEKSNTLNNEFLSLIFKSTLFKEDFKFYVSNVLSESYQKVVRNKVDKFLC